MNASRKVLFVGWDSADWRVINPLLKAHKLPNLEHLIKNGVSGNMATLSPILSPMLWTSIATGKRPHKHGIHGFAEPDPEAGGVRPITNLSRKTKAVWNILSQNLKKCIVIGWWPSHPAEPLPCGVMVSNAYQRATNACPTQSWPMIRGTVEPASFAEALTKKRLHPAQLDNSLLLPFVKNVDKINPKQDRRIGSLTKIIADSINVHSAAMHFISDVPWDFMAVYYDAIDHFGHGFMRYHPPRQKWIPKKDFDLYSGVIEAAYIHHDAMLGELLKAAGPGVTVLLMSDHGFHPDKLRPAAIPIEPAGPAVEHRPYGIFVLSGSDLKKGSQIQGATVLDICPTLLSLFGFPVGQDMDGKPLVTAWLRSPTFETIPSWDVVSGPDGTHPTGTRLDPDDSREALKQLVALGYIEALPKNAEQAMDKARRELRYNLACSYIDAQLLDAAAEIFDELWKEQPDQHRHGAKLLTCQLALGRYTEARATFEQLRINRRNDSVEAARELQKRRQELKDRKTKDLKPKEQKELNRLISRTKLSPVPMQQMEAMLLLAENKAKKAVKILENLVKSHPTDPDFYIHMGRGYIALEKWEKAEKIYRTAVELDSDNTHGHFGLAQVFLARRQNYKAIDAALSAIGLLYHNPSAHFLLGVALHRLGKLKHAVEALQVCLTQNCNFLLAHRRLEYIYKNRLKNHKKAIEHRKKFREGIERLRIQRLEASTRLCVAKSKTSVYRPTIDSVESIAKTETIAFDPASLLNARSDVSFVTIVSGLPRSGTSLMMQMLAAGGLPALHDGCRSADADNPRGYYEFAPAKNIRINNSWMPLARGRVLKLIVQLLSFLPHNYEYRIILMDRSLDEVLNSQKVMLNRNGRRGAELSSEKLRTVYAEQVLRVTELLERRNLSVLRIRYQEAINNATCVAHRVTDFLGIPLDCSAMAATVDPSLHRQRFSSKICSEPVALSDNRT